MIRVKLVEICNPKQWKTISSKDLKSEGYPVYGANGIIGYCNEYNHLMPTVTITCRGATCGNIHLTKEKSYVNGNAMCLDELSDRVDLKYLYYALKAYDFDKVISGSAQPQITRIGLQKVEINLVGMQQQIKIVAQMDLLEKIILAKKAQLAKLDELVKSRFIEMFGRLNEHKGELTSFVEMTELITDGEHATPKRTTRGIYLLSARNVLNHELCLNDVDYIDEAEYARIAKRIVPLKGDVLISCSGTIGRCCAIKDDLKFQMVRSVALLRFKKEINPIYAEYMITSEDLQHQIYQSQTASSQANLFQGKIAKLKGYVPPIDKQNEFADFVTSTDKSKTAIQKSLDDLETLKKSLMQQYFA